ncbi:uncharacterized protein RJT21DRAFT_59019 [Scheffersomyces amazonensis]|uniref:uncharacterized protein n=1 Tax=Scheffersomyces amazonensis TaxID=1078765 RepID=UPI00315D9DCE
MATRSVQEPRPKEVVERPLISARILDEASQRVFLVSLFIAIQSWKIYDIMLLKTSILEVAGQSVGTSSNNLTIVLKYAIIDGIFLWILPILNIQYITFSPFITLLLTIILNGITLFMVSDLGVILISGIALPVWNTFFHNRELTIGGDRIDTNRLIDLDSHFKGRLTINYLPDSSAKMNPFHFDRICLDSSNSHANPIEIPIEFNTTTDIGFLQIQHTTPKNEIKLLNYTGNSIKRLLRKDYSHLSKYSEYKQLDNIFYVEFPVTEPGLYQIKQVIDGKNINIRTYKSELVIPNCPGSQFYYPSSYDETKNYQCISRNSPELSVQVPLIEYYGVTPGILTLSSRINGKPYRDFKLSIGEKVSEINIKDLSWLKSNSLIRNSLEQELLKDETIIRNAGEGTLEFQLVQVSDTLGNVRRYNPVSRDKDVWFVFNLRKAPVFGLEDNNKGTELIIGSNKKLSLVGTGSLQESDFPVSVTISYDNNNNNNKDLLASNISKTFSSLQDLSNGIEVEREGHYTLTNARTRFCQAEIDKNNMVSLKLAQPPSVEIEATPLIDKCLGTTGYEFGFDFKGKAPFYIQYHVYQNQSNGILRPIHNDRGVTSRLLKSSDKNYKFTFRPPAEGNYVVKFDDLKDVNYYNYPVIVDKTYSTYFQKLSQVSLGGSRTIKSCYGDSVRIPMKFEGNGPFSFSYEFIELNSGQRLTPTNSIQGAESYDIVIPATLNGKSFQIKLVKAEDKFSCPALIDNNEVVIVQSRSFIPEIQIGSVSETFTIIEGDHVDIPLQYKSSIGPTRNDKITYKIIKDKSIEQKVIGGSHILQAKDEAQYSLVSFENDGCPGIIKNIDRTVTVSYYNKPNLTLSSDNILKQHKEESTLHLSAVCKDCKNPLKLKLEGANPFVIDYEIRFPSGKVESGSMNIDNHDVVINLPSKEVGRYQHTFTAVYDSLYTKHKSRNRKQKSQIVLYDVNPLPSVKFHDDNRSIQVCENKLNQLEKSSAKVPILVSGQYPLTVNASLKHEITGRVETLIFQDVTEPLLNIYGGESFGLGEHILTINSITDGNGCKTESISQDNYFVIVITELPNMKRSDIKRDYCVGDHISYELSGVAPFSVFYNFNGRQQKAESNHHFSRLASKPGILSIEAVQDSSASKCLANFTNMPEKSNELTLEVHRLPSVEVNKGDYIIEDLHEGDQTEIIFTFIGTPPFKLTYVRISETDHTSKAKKSAPGKRPVVEKHVIDDIQDYELIIKASLEGTYEAIEVQDAFCIARRSNY